MRSVFILIVLVFICLSGNSQTGKDTTDIDRLEVFSDEGKDAATIPQKSDRFDADLTVGTSFSYSPGNYYGPAYYVAPSFSYLVSQRFSLSAGIALQQSMYYPLCSHSEGYTGKLSLTRAFIFTRGDYLLTPRLKVGGMVYKSINDVPRLHSYAYPYNYSYQGVSFDLQYKFSNSFSIGFEMRMQNTGYGSSSGDEAIPPAGYLPVPGF